MYLTTLHEHAPMIREWCPRCLAYTEHTNGSVKSTTATRCCTCYRITFYR